MASSGGGDGSQLPWAVMEGLADLRERAAMLHTMLEGSRTPLRAAGTELTEGMMSSLSSAMSALNTAGDGGDGGASSSAGGRPGSAGRRRRGVAVGAGPQRRSSSSFRRRTLSPFLKTVTAAKIDDDHQWRKYGQKHIQESHNPRSYYRCTHTIDQGCKARKQVQASETNPSEFIISYFGHHTCRDLSTIPLVIEASDAAPANFISFGSTVNGAPTSSAYAVPHHQAAIDPMMMFSRFVSYSSSLPAQERCGSEEAISSISPPAGELSAVVGSAGKTSTTTVGSAPEQWLGGACSHMGGGIDTAGSFPSSPSSHEVMAGSFESFGNGYGMDDDMFGFDL